MYIKTLRYIYIEKKSTKNGLKLGYYHDYSDYKYTLFPGLYAFPMLSSNNGIDTTVILFYTKIIKLLSILSKNSWKYTKNWQKIRNKQTALNIMTPIRKKYNCHYSHTYISGDIRVLGIKQYRAFGVRIFIPEPKSEIRLVSGIYICIIISNSS